MKSQVGNSCSCTSSIYFASVRRARSSLSDRRDASGGTRLALAFDNVGHRANQFEVSDVQRKFLPTSAQSVKRFGSLWHSLRNSANVYCDCNFMNVSGFMFIVCDFIMVCTYVLQQFSELTSILKLMVRSGNTLRIVFTFDRFCHTF